MPGPDARLNAANPLPVTLGVENIRDLIERLQPDQDRTRGIDLGHVGNVSLHTLWGDAVRWSRGQEENLTPGAPGEPAAVILLYLAVGYGSMPCARATIFQHIARRNRRFPERPIRAWPLAHRHAPSLGTSVRVTHHGCSRISRNRTIVWSKCRTAAAVSRPV